MPAQGYLRAFAEQKDVKVWMPPVLSKGHFLAPDVMLQAALFSHRSPVARLFDGSPRMRQALSQDFQVIACVVAQRER